MSLVEWEEIINFRAGGGCFIFVGEIQGGKKKTSVAES